MTPSDKAKELARKLWRKNWQGKISEREMDRIEKEQDDDDNRESANRRQQSVRSVSVERAGSTAGSTDDGQAGDIHNADDFRRADGCGEGGRRFFGEL